MSRLVRDQLQARAAKFNIVLDDVSLTQYAPSLFPALYPLFLLSLFPEVAFFESRNPRALVSQGYALPYILCDFVIAFVAQNEIFPSLICAGFRSFVEFHRFCFIAFL